MKKIKNLFLLLIAIIALSATTPNTYSAPTPLNQYNGYRGNSGNQDKEKDKKGNRPDRIEKPYKDKTTLGNIGGNSDKRYDGNRGKRKDFDKEKNRRPIRGDKWSDNRKPGRHHDWDDDRHHGNHGHYRPVTPPRRPYRPRPHIVHRPTRPHNYCPYDHAPILRTVLGLEFGFRIYTCIDRLRNTGYFIDGYSDHEVYLRNVKELGYKWEDAILYYSRGGLTNVSFYYSSHKHSTKRYDKLYKRLCREYGRPVMYTSRHNMMEASWFDGSGRNFVTLSFKYERSFGGSSRYYTTLTYGN